MPNITPGAGIITKKTGGFFIDLYLPMTKQSKAFDWKGAQSELVWMMIAEGKIPSNPTKTRYKAVYDASEGDVLKFQNFHSSWKNVSHNLAASGAVLGSTGLH